MLNLIILALIFIRPFIASLAFTYADFIYSCLLIFFLLIWIWKNGIALTKIKPLEWPIILFSLALLISCVFSVNKISSFGEIINYLSGILILLAAASFSSEYRIRVIRIIIAAGFIISLMAIYQYFFGLRHTLEYMDKMGINDSFALSYLTRKRAFFPFITPNVLAGYLILVIPLTLGIKKYMLVLPFLFFALLLTKSLGGLCSLFLALGIYSYSQKRISKKMNLILFLLLTISIAVIFAGRSNLNKEHLRPLFSTSMRMSYWKETFNIIKNAPLTGIGIGNLDLAQSRFTHNSYLQLFAETGILGIFAYLWIVFLFIKKGIKNELPGWLFAASLAFLLHNIVDFSFFLPEVSLIWWVIMGLGVSSF